MVNIVFSFRMLVGLDLYFNTHNSYCCVCSVCPNFEKELTSSLLISVSLRFCHLCWLLLLRMTIHTLTMCLMQWLECIVLRLYLLLGCFNCNCGGTTVGAKIIEFGIDFIIYQTCSRLHSPMVNIANHISTCAYIVRENVILDERIL